MPKTMILFGWNYANDPKRHLLYPCRVKDGGWNVEESITVRTFRFHSFDEAVQFWRSRHRFPDDYEHCIHDGYLHFFEEKGGTGRLVPILPL